MKSEEEDLLNEDTIEFAKEIGSDYIGYGVDTLVKILRDVAPDGYKGYVGSKLGELQQRMEEDMEDTLDDILENVGDEDDAE